jgi:uncharacterized membrane protein
MKNIEFFVVFVIYWILTIIYCLRWHHKEGNLKTPTILFSIFLGPLLFLVLVDNNIEMKKIERENKRIENERESNNRHRRWFQTLGLINRNSTPNYWRSIPPPPPISRVERAQTERDEAIRMAIERIDKNKLKDFKFLRSNVKDTER